MSNSSKDMTVRTRFAPSPTGAMHVGNLRTALYEYLTAKSQNGAFILRIEDTDRERLVEGAENIIYDTLRAASLTHDEGPDIGGGFGPYVQSERLSLYLPYAKQLVEEKKAYYCFCSKERLQELKDSSDAVVTGYDRHCRDLPEDEVQKHLAAGDSYVIRQKMPLSGQTSFSDLVYGTITVPNEDLDDQILIKADGFPTYNFANIIDDHLMQITHVVRGSEYLSSTPKYNLLYEAFGWELPVYIHLPLIQGRNEDGSVSKLSKRHGSTSFDALISEGYLPEAIINYIALLGWAPKDAEREIFSLPELVEAFSEDGISKSPSIFDYAKLEWMNGEYIRNMKEEEFLSHAAASFDELSGGKKDLYPLLTEIMQPRLTRFSQIREKLLFLPSLPDYSSELYVHKKSKTTLESSLEMLIVLKEKLSSLEPWNMESLRQCLTDLAEEKEVKNAFVMWPLRIAITGMAVTPGGAIEALLLLGKEESLYRMDIGIKKLSDL